VKRLVLGAKTSKKGSGENKKGSGDNNNTLPFKPFCYAANCKIQNQITNFVVIVSRVAKGNFPLRLSQNRA
jgi:hypothetical protein